MYSTLILLILHLLSRCDASPPPYQPVHYASSKHPSSAQTNQRGKHLKKDCSGKVCSVRHDTNRQYLARHTAAVKGVSSCLQFLELNGHDPQTIEDLPCDHDCEDDGSCSNGTISCYPHRSCTVHCTGDDSCNNLMIKSQDTVDLHCEGSNSCRSLKFVSKPVGNRKYVLPFIEIPSPLQFKSSQIEVGEYYILGKGVSTPSILEDIKLSRMRCFNSGHSESRNFGEQEQTQSRYEGGGHKVLYCDDCVLNSVYQYYKHILWTFLEHKRQQIVYDADLSLKFTDSDSDFRLQEEGYHFPWDEHIYNFDKLEARVVEYIVYGDQGNLGWHHDDDSEITMVIMVSNDALFEGGFIEMRKDHIPINLMQDDEVEIYGYDIDDMYFGDELQPERNVPPPERLRLQWGEVLIFDSRTDHRILAVENGYRHVFVIEWWGLGRSLRNGRTEIDVHEIDLNCLDSGGGMGCWREDRGETFDGYDNDEYVEDQEILRE